MGTVNTVTSLDSDSVVSFNVAGQNFGGTDKGGNGGGFYNAGGTQLTIDGGTQVVNNISCAVKQASN